MKNKKTRKTSKQEKQCLQTFVARGHGSKCNLVFFENAINYQMTGFTNLQKNPQKHIFQIIKVDFTSVPRIICRQFISKYICI